MSSNGDGDEEPTGGGDSERDGEAESADPLGDLAAEIDSRRDDDSGTAGDTFEEAFDEMDVDTVDADAVWADLLSGGETAAINPPRIEDADAGRDVREISKRTCHGCRFFSDPPGLHCEHDGTEIREVVDMTHYRVVDCPMVVDSEDVGLE